MPQSPPQELRPIAVEVSVTMSHAVGNDNMLEDDKAFRKAFFDMVDMVKVL